MRYWNAKNLYGVTDEQWKLIADRLTVGPCEICGNQEAMTIDHDHTKKQFRGLLCQKCNKMLGLAHDKSVVLRSAAAYLERWNGVQ